MLLHRIPKDVDQLENCFECPAVGEEELSSFGVNCLLFALFIVAWDFGWRLGE